MKNRKSMIILGIIVAVLMLGIGYATVSSVNLEINGTASAKDADLNVTITAANPNDSSAAVYGTVTNPAGLTATIHVEDMDKIGSEGAKTVTYTITNGDKVAAKITESTITGANEYFGVDTDLTDAGITIAAGATGTVKITVTLLKMPATEANSSTDISVKLLAEAVES